MSIRLRPATLADLSEIMQIYNQEVCNGTATWNDQSFSLSDFQQIYYDLANKQYPFFVAEDQLTQRIAGYADYASFRSIAGFRHTVELSIFIHPEYTQQGLGSALLQALIEHAKQHHIHVMIAAIDHCNLASIKLHEKFGFQQTAYMPQVGQKLGTWRDLVLMQLQVGA